MSLSRFLALTTKEFKHLFRDIRMLGILLVFPAFLLIVFGYAVNFDVQNISLAVFDKDNSRLSRDFAESLSHSKYFSLVRWISKDREIRTVLDENIAQCVLTIPPGFEKDVFSRKKTAVQISIDGVNGNTATIIQNYMFTATNNFNNKVVQSQLRSSGVKTYQPLDVRPVFWFNPDLKTTRFLIPGLMGMILIMTSVISVTLSLVREKERGTIEQLDVSPIVTPDLLLGKAFPYLILAFFNTALVLGTGYIFFGVVVKGSLFQLFITTLLFLSASIALGILVSVISDSQQIAFMIATMLSLLPSIILSGFIFPIEGMPVVIQILSNITPVKFYVIILRAIILRGVGWEAFYPQMIYLFLFFMFFMTLAMLAYYAKAKKA